MTDDGHHTDDSSTGDGEDHAGADHDGVHHGAPDAPTPRVLGRGTPENPGNRFEALEVAGWDGEFLESEYLDSGREDGTLTRRTPTKLYRDNSRSVLARNDSPDLPFDYGLNPYRGCEHGCSYCYARPSHEYLGFSAGLDFETQIMVKQDAPELLERELSAPGWKAQAVLMSGNTDCYQPAEKALGITRRCLEVFLKLRHPVEVITKNALILRDRDLLAELASHGLVRATLSVTSLDAQLSRDLEPRASSPAARLDAIAQLSAAGVPVRVNVAPLIPALNEEELPAILAEAAARGATYGNYLLLRLPQGVEALFLAWLERERPQRAAKVLGALRQVRGGKLYDPRFGKRMRGEGPRAEAIARLFQVTCAKLGLERDAAPLTTHLFRPTPPAQQSLGL